MKIDLHFHTKTFSACSRIELEQGIVEAKRAGLDGICITDHDVFADRVISKALGEKHGILVIVGVEILTSSGDILCFGLNSLPSPGISAQGLIDYVNQQGGACIAAHPYRNNNRGLKDMLYDVKGLHAIEVLNGNTDDVANTRALLVAEELGIAQTGGSDAHDLHKIGVYYTAFQDWIQDETDLVTALRSGDFVPMSG